MKNLKKIKIILVLFFLAILAATLSYQISQNSNRSQNLKNNEWAKHLTFPEKTDPLTIRKSETKKGMDIEATLDISDNYSFFPQSGKMFIAGLDCVSDYGHDEYGRPVIIRTFEVPDNTQIVTSTISDKQKEIKSYKGTISSRICNSEMCSTQKLKTDENSFLDKNYKDIYIDNDEELRLRILPLRYNTEDKKAKILSSMKINIKLRLPSDSEQIPDIDSSNNKDKTPPSPPELQKVIKKDDKAEIKFTANSDDIETVQAYHANKGGSNIESSVEVPADNQTISISLYTPDTRKAVLRSYDAAGNMSKTTDIFTIERKNK